MSISSIAGAVAIVLLSVVAVPAQQSITVGPNVQVSKGLASEPHYEISSAPSSTNPIGLCRLRFLPLATGQSSFARGKNRVPIRFLLVLRVD